MAAPTETFDGTSIFQMSFIMLLSVGLRFGERRLSPDTVASQSSVAVSVGAYIATGVLTASVVQSISSAVDPVSGEFYVGNLFLLFPLWIAVIYLADTLRKIAMKVQFNTFARWTSVVQISIMSFVPLPLFLEILDHPALLDLGVFAFLAELPDTVNALLFISLPATVAVVVIERSSQLLGKNRKFASGAILVGVVNAPLVTLLEDAPFESDVTFALIAALNALFLPLLPTTSYRAGILLGTAVICTGAFGAGVLSNRFNQLSSTSVLVLPLLLGTIAVVLWRRSRVEDEVLTGQAAIMSVIFVIDIFQELWFEVLNAVEFGIINLTMTGILSLSALYFILVTLKADESAESKPLKILDKIWDV